MNEEVDSFLSERLSNLLLTCKVNPIAVDNKKPPLIGSQHGNFKIESPSSTGIPVLRVQSHVDERAEMSTEMSQVIQPPFLHSKRRYFETFSLFVFIVIVNSIFWF